MGCLVKAEHLLLKKDVAIKFVLAGRSSSSRSRLFREARAAQALSCEQVVRVFDLGVHATAPYIVMELLEGCDLSARLRGQGPLAASEAVDCVLEACIAIAEAHALGIVHRDLKPANLFATRSATREVIKVLDFGISKVPESEATDDCERTAEGMLLGTPHYMSPEQLRNPTNIDGRADVWALGVTLFQLLSNQHPFPGSNAREVTAAIFSDPPRPLTELCEVSPELWQVVRRALAKRPEQRTPSVEALVRELAPFASKRGLRAAEQVYGGEPPASGTQLPVAGDATPAAATEDGLSSTAGSDALAAHEPTPERPRLRRAPAALLAVGVAVATAALWPTREASPPSSAPPSTPMAGVETRAEENQASASSPSPTASSAATAPATSAQVAESVPSHRPIRAPSASAARQPPAARTARNVPAAPRPPPAEPSASRPRDIDGVPIPN